MQTRQIRTLISKLPDISVCVYGRSHRVDHFQCHADHVYRYHYHLPDVGHCHSHAYRLQRYQNIVMDNVGHPLDDRGDSVLLRSISTNGAEEGTCWSFLDTLLVAHTARRGAIALQAPRRGYVVLEADRGVLNAQ